MKALLLRGALYLAQLIIRDVITKKTQPHPDQPLNPEVAGALAEEQIAKLLAKAK